MKRSQKFKVRIDGALCYGVAFYADEYWGAHAPGKESSRPFSPMPDDIQIYSIMCMIKDKVTPVFYKDMLRRGVIVLPDDFLHPDIDRIFASEAERQRTWDLDHPKEVEWDKRIGLHAKGHHAHAVIKTIYRYYLEGILSVDQAYELVIDVFKMNSQGLVWRGKAKTYGDHARIGDTVYGYLYIQESSLGRDSYGAPRYFIGFCGGDGSKREYEIDPGTLEILVGEDTPEYRKFEDKLAQLELKPYLDSLEVPKEI